MTWGRRAAWLVAALIAGSVPGFAEATATINLFGTFHAMGVEVRLDAGDDPDQDAITEVSYRTGTAAYAGALPLVRTDASTFVGSLFGVGA